MTDPYRKAAADSKHDGSQVVARLVPNRSLAEPTNVLLQFALVVCRLILVNDTFRSKSVKNGLYLRKLSLRLRPVGCSPQLLHECAHFAPMSAITLTPLGILAYPFRG